MRVGLLGGSYDPVHYGHLRAAEWALEAFGLNRVLLIPARRSPFKGPASAPDPDRLAMLKLAARDNEALRVDDCELARDAPSYTVDTLRDLCGRSPDDTFALIVGSDAARGIEQWREISAIREMAEIRVLGRPGASAFPGASEFQGLAISSTEIREAVSQGRSIRYLTPESVRLYIEEKGLYK
ncbi:MAG: nicotinate (nicotinamide) nucleotide adenylyltransferase [Vicinamibacteria bacterium]|nr:nicotinate (nicotinamide) nucleotide adenylyltransferase [Vicinamibacteria bacterium]MBP9945122.1 nicotinate (nicotinamide) nucleotide adenylyltransferase [Vicinamibacteria bacterium]